jgi:hypothetical protein
MFRSCCRYCAHPSQIMRWSRSFDQVAPSPSLLRRNQHSLPVEKPAWSPRSPQQLASSLFKAFFLIYEAFGLLRCSWVPFFTESCMSCGSIAVTRDPKEVDSRAGNRCPLKESVPWPKFL